jgi:polysaccharide deacetylase family protein (PEP-CTERM system associated)
MSSEKPTPNAFTVDVEEWFHIIDADQAPTPAEWDRQESRVEGATERLLEILAGADVRATFFFLGWIAERHPELVRRVAAAGHEIATHGYAHELVYRLGPEGFREDTRRAKGTIEDLAGAGVVGYRAASFSITPETPWAFDVLAAEGFAYDSSLFPAPRAHGGFSLDRMRPFRITGPEGGELWEFPIVPFRVGSWSVAFAGGGYLRLFPLRLVELATRSLNRRGVPVTYYVHPREVDPEQPRMPLSWKRRFQYYVNLRATPAKLAGLLSRRGGRFLTLAELLEDGLTADPPLHLAR